MTFRARPRGLANILKRIHRAALSPQRNYQGQLVTITGSLGGYPVTGAVAARESRVNLPANMGSIVRAEVVIQVIDQIAPWRIYVNNIDTAVIVSAPGRYDITGYVQRDGTNVRTFVALQGGSGSGSYEIIAELLVRV